MNDYENEISLADLKIALRSRDYETAREMLDGKYEGLFKAYQNVAKEMELLSPLKFKSSKELEKLSSDEEGLRLIVCLLELATNDGIMVTNAQLNNQEERK